MKKFLPLLALPCVLLSGCTGGSGEISSSEDKVMKDQMQNRNPDFDKMPPQARAMMEKSKSSAPSGPATQ